MAALRALAADGVSAVAVDVLAKRMGVSRGSFYWHFENRRALLVAALEKWERLASGDVIARLERIRDPGERARALFEEALGGEHIAGLEPALIGQARDPEVTAVVARVNQTRIDYLTRIFTELGFGARAARHRAVCAYAAYLGWLDLRRSSPGVVPEVGPDDEGSGEALDHLVATLLSPVAEAGRGRGGTRSARG